MQRLFEEIIRRCYMEQSLQDMLLVGRRKWEPGYLGKGGSESSMMLLQSPCQSSAGTRGESMSPAIDITPARQPKMLGIEEVSLDFLGADFLGAEARSLLEDIFSIISVLSAGIILGAYGFARSPGKGARAYMLKTFFSRSTPAPNG